MTRAENTACLKKIPGRVLQTSKTTQRVCALLRKRDAVGQKKYGKTLDRSDLGTTDWLQHLIEELLDGAVYALRAQDTSQEIRHDKERLQEIKNALNGVLEDLPSWFASHPDDYHHAQLRIRAIRDYAQ